MGMSEGFWRLADRLEVTSPRSPVATFMAYGSHTHPPFPPCQDPVSAWGKMGGSWVEIW